MSNESLLGEFEGCLVRDSEEARGIVYARASSPIHVMQRRQDFHGPVAPEMARALRRARADALVDLRGGCTAAQFFVNRDDWREYEAARRADAVAIAWKSDSCGNFLAQLYPYLFGQRVAVLLPAPHAPAEEPVTVAPPDLSPLRPRKVIFGGQEFEFMSDDTVRSNREARRAEAAKRDPLVIERNAMFHERQQIEDKVVDLLVGLDDRVSVAARYPVQMTNLRPSASPPKTRFRGRWSASNRSR